MPSCDDNRSCDQNAESTCKASPLIIRSCPVFACPLFRGQARTGKGSINITRAGSKFRITIANEVRFVGNVKGFAGRIQSAINHQANAMRRLADYLLRKALKKSKY